MRLGLAFFTVAGLALAGCAAPLPAGLTADELSLFVAGVEKAGCAVNDDATAAIVEKHTGFDDDKLREISRYMLDQGTLVLEGETIRLASGNCADA